MSALELRVLGPPEVRVDGEARPVRTRKALALLGYLALEPGPHARETLAALFWPDSAPEVARSSLRNSLTYLRQALGNASGRVVTDRDTVRLRLDPGDTLDLQALEQGQLAVFRGDVLPGLGLEDGEALGAWLDTQRGRVRALAERVYAAHTRALVDTSPTEAAELARRWLALDNLNEEAWRRLIQALLAAGQRSAAREALAACHAVLRQELGVAPAPETLALAAHLEGRPEREREVQPTPSLPGFVGRASELGRLGAVFQAAGRGGVRGAVLTGEPGIGKTSLAAAFAHGATGAGARVLRGWAAEAQTVTLGVWTDLLRSALDGVDPLTLPLLPVWRTELARLLPEWRTGEAPPPAGQADLAPLLEALTQALVALAGGSVLVLLLDDAQWMDATSRDALLYVARRLGQAGTRAMLLLTARAEALQPGEEPAAWIARLGRDVPLERLALGPLTEAETRAWVAEAARGQDARDVAGWLHGYSGGQPLYLTEAFRDLLERGAIDTSGSRWQVRPDRAVTLPPGVRAVIEERSSRLPPAGLAAAQACAVLGEGATFDRLRGVADLTAEDALGGVEALLGSGLLHEVAEPGDVTYRLSHDRVGETLRENLSLLRRRLLHRRALAAFGEQAPPAVLARHAVGAGMLPEARLYLRRSAAEADRLGFFRASRAALEEALALGPAGTERAELLLLHAEACERLGDAGGQLQAGREALSLARELDAPHLVVQALNRLAWVQQEEISVARPLSEEALAVARRLGDPFLLVSSLQGVARSYRGEDPHLALRLQREAMDLLHAAGDAKRLGHGHMNMAYTEEALGNHAAAPAHLRLAVAAFRAARHDALVAMSLADLGVRLISLGEAAEAGAVLSEAVELRERARPRAPAIRAAWACALALTGDELTGWEVLRRGLEEEANAPAWVLTLVWAARFLAACGRLPEALTLVGTARNAAPRTQADSVREHTAPVLDLARSELEEAGAESALARGAALTLGEGVAFLRGQAPR
ncbi:ATP-binding protein [Deinococcus aerius]|uniref:ATP-binding protein n=1 Tax=Deinococcus aerius TaxID=200253 RepID=UPI0013FE1912|nr:AAA family ATPase [Deinococcus aerius]